METGHTVGRAGIEVVELVLVVLVELVVVLVELVVVLAACST